MFQRRHLSSIKQKIPIITLEIRTSIIRDTVWVIRTDTLKPDRFKVDLRADVEDLIVFRISKIYIFINMMYFVVPFCHEGVLQLSCISMNGILAYENERKLYIQNLGANVCADLLIKSFCLYFPISFVESLIHWHDFHLGNYIWATSHH